MNSTTYIFLDLPLTGLCHSYLHAMFSQNSFIALFSFEKRSILAKSINHINCTTVALIENSIKTNEYEHKKTQILVDPQRGDSRVQT